ncbi:MAG: hypothetical protein GXP35_15860 [Actinobacteria bacterium]|nr:hypothetical protein [Actinomycetota bacterium]
MEDNWEVFLIHSHDGDASFLAAHLREFVTSLGRADEALESARTMREAAGAEDCWTHSIIGANIMFDLEVVEWSTTDRSGVAIVFVEGVPTLGLLLVTFGVVRSGKESAAAFAPPREPYRTPGTGFAT